MRSIVAALAAFALSSCGSSPPAMPEPPRAVQPGAPRAEIAARPAPVEAKGEPLGQRLERLATAIPPGWGLEIQRREAVTPRPLWLARLVFANPSTACIVRFGSDRASTRFEHPHVTAYVYRVEDAPVLHAMEAPFREVSSHCPADVPLIETGSYFVAVSPCDRGFGFDGRCDRAVAELEASLRAVFSDARP